MINAYFMDDIDIITSVIKHPKIWPHVSDDFCDYDSFNPAISGLWIGIDIGNEFSGCFWLTAENSITWQIHTCLLPSAWGRSKECGCEAMALMFSEMPCEKIITLVPAGNVLALRLAKKCGFVVEGCITKSILRGGVLIDQTLLGLSRGDLCR